MNKLSKIIQKIILICLAFSCLIFLFTCDNRDFSDGQSAVDFQKLGIDFIFEFSEGQDITILQLADIQAMQYDGIRNVGNRWAQVNGAFFSSGVVDNYVRYWQYVEEGISKTAPDLIILTGDNIYGETDDDGRLWLEMINFLDSFEIPWLCIFGNHDNESQKGVIWQIQAINESKYGHIKEGSCINGNSNYTVGIKQSNKLKYVFYMLDTNGCTLKPHNYGESLLPDNPNLSEIQQTIGIYSDQISWMTKCNRNIISSVGEVPSMMFFHVPPYEAYYSVSQRYADTYGTFPFYAERDGDKGMALERIGGFQSNTFFNTAKEMGCVGMFVGHQHKVATSTTYDGIRITYGLKTGTGDYHSSDMLGTTKITIKESDNSFDVEYIHSDIDYPLD